MRVVHLNNGLLGRAQTFVAMQALWRKRLHCFLTCLHRGLCDSYIVEGLCPQLIVSFLRDRKRSAIAKIIQSHPIRLSRAPRGKRGDDRQAKSDGPDDEWNIVRSRWRDGGEERRKQCGDGRAEVLRDRHS